MLARLSAVLLVLAHASDAGARELVGRWSDVGARLVTGADLGRAGWRHDPAEPERDVAVAEGEEVSAVAVTGILTCWRHVLPADLPHLVRADRAFAAAECSAMLSAWLAARRCPVVSPPQAGSLSGPAWGPERWLAEAARCGLHRQPLTAPHAAPAEEDPAAATVTAVAGRVVDSAGPIDRRRTAAVLRLAAASGVVALRVSFDAERADVVRSAGPDVDLTRPTVAQAVLAHLTGCPA